MSSLRLIVILSCPKSRMNALHVVIALNYFTLVCNVVSVLVEMAILVTVKVDNFSKDNLIAVYSKF